jgi:hypothetical protein
MPTKADLLTELNWLTEKISSQVWTLNVGTLGTTWSLLIADQFSPRSAIWIVVPCLLSILCELGQYLSAYILEEPILDEMEENDRTEFQYPASVKRYRQFFFRCKIGLTIFAALALIYTLVQKFM